MGEEAEYLEEQGGGIDAWINEQEEIERAKKIEKTELRLMGMSNDELLDYICGQGNKLNTLPSFKTYDIAKRLKDNKWTPTSKQREALITTAAIALNS